MTGFNKRNENFLTKIAVENLPASIKMKYLFTFRLATTLFITSCNGQDSLKTAPYNISKEGDGITFNYDTLSVEYIALANKSLIDRSYKFTTDKTFETRIKDIFEFDITQYKNKIVVLKPSMFPNIAIKEKNFVLIEDPDFDSKEKINTDLLFYYNNYLFNNDRVAYNYLKLNQSILLKDLVRLFGYNKDKELVKFAFDGFDFNNEISFHDLIFSYNISDKKFYIRKGIFDDIENIIFGGETEDFSYAKDGVGYNRVSNIIDRISENKTQYFQPEETIAYLYDKQLRIGVTGNIEETLNKNSSYKDFLEKNNFYGFERLRDYAETIYQPTEVITNKVMRFTIFDKDGFSNLRKEKGATSEIVQKIKSGESVDVLDNSGDWFLVKTKEGKEGYVHKSRIKSN